jgi:hypothetical protein
MKIMPIDIEKIIFRDNPDELNILFSYPEIQELARSMGDFRYQMSLAVFTIHYGLINTRGYVFQYVKASPEIYTEMLCDLISLGISDDGIDFLLQKGALIDGKADGERIPLFKAFGVHDFNTAQYLVERGANLYVLDSKKRNLLEYVLEWYTPGMDDEDDEIVALRSIGYKNIPDNLLIKNQDDEEGDFDPFA